MPRRILKIWNSSGRHKISLIVTGIFACVIAYLTLTPQPVPIISGGDKLHHLIGFAALSLPASILYRQALLWLLPGIIAFGGAIELVQPYVNRRGEWGDFWADIAGVLAGVIIGLIVRQIILFFIEARGREN